MIDHDEEGRLREELEDIDQSETGPAKNARLERFILKADHAKLIDLGLEARWSLLESILNSGTEHEKLLPAFTWCIAKVDEEPEFERTTYLLEFFRWVIFGTANLVPISVAQIDKLLKDMAKRFIREGYTLRRVHLIEREISCDLGDPARARNAHQAFQKSRKDWMADDEETEAHYAAKYWLLIGQEGRALRAGARFIDGTREDKVYDRIHLHEYLVPLLKAGRLEEAKECQQRSLRALKRHDGEGDSYGVNALFLALVGDFAKAKAVAEKSLALVRPDSGLAARRDLYCPLAAVFHLFAKHKPRTLFRMPDGYSDAGRNPAELAAWFRTKALAVAGKFDARNGNDYWTRRVDEVLELEQYYQPIAGN